MSYEKAMKWSKKHPKGTKQPILMHTESGFTPSLSFYKKWLLYATPLDNLGLPYMDMETYYHKSKSPNFPLRNGTLSL